MTRTLIGSAVTDANGVASIPYTGTGAGKTRIIAVYGDDTLVSEEYNLIDASIIQTGKTTGWYQTTVTLEDGRLKWVYDSSSNQYVSVRGNSISSLTGTTFTVRVKIESSKNVGLAVYYQDTSSGSYAWINAGLETISDSEVHELTVTIPSNSTNNWIRLQTSASSLVNNDVVYIDEFVVYES